jgi:hypothetical protein
MLRTHHGFGDLRLRSGGGWALYRHGHGWSLLPDPDLAGPFLSWRIWEAGSAAMDLTVVRCWARWATSM